MSVNKNSIVDSFETWRQSKELHYFKLYEVFWTKNAIGDGGSTPHKTLKTGTVYACIESL